MSASFIRVDFEQYAEIVVEGKPTTQELLQWLRKDYETRGPSALFWNFTKASIRNLKPMEYTEIAIEIKTLAAANGFVDQRVAFCFINEEERALMAVFKVVVIDEGLPVEYRSFSDTFSAKRWLLN